MAQSPEMTDLQSAVAEEDTVIGSFIAYANGLADKVEESAGDKEASVALAADIRTQAQSMGDAMVRNTPVTPAEAKRKGGSKR